MRLTIALADRARDRAYSNRRSRCRAGVVRARPPARADSNVDPHRAPSEWLGIATTTVARVAADLVARRCRERVRPYMRAKPHRLLYRRSPTARYEHQHRACDRATDRG